MNQDTRRLRYWARSLSPSALLLGLALGGCGTPERERVPTPAFLALCPQRIALDDLQGAGSARENQVAAELAHQLRKLGYDVVDPGRPADATIRYALESEGSGREWYSGVASARVMVSLELRGPSGIVFEGYGLGYGTDEFADNEDEVDDMADVYLGWLVDGVADELDPPDYEEMYAVAVRSAVYDALREFPERLEPAARP